MRLDAGGLASFLIVDVANLTYPVSSQSNLVAPTFDTNAALNRYEPRIVFR